MGEEAQGQAVWEYTAEGLGVGDDPSERTFELRLKRSMNYQLESGRGTVPGVFEVKWTELSVVRRKKGVSHHSFIFGLDRGVNGNGGLRRRICPVENADFRFGRDEIKVLPVSHPERGSGSQENQSRVEKGLRTINGVVIISVTFFIL